ncbi:MAG: hypothetical protein NT008_10145 [Methylococcales bacterium]|nr:hypothetical protein [Methylococcales bacterium]
MISDYQIEEKAEELLAGRIADDDYLNDALCDCFAEVREIMKANSLDDKLSAIDNFKAMLTKHIAQEDALNKEAFDFLKNQEQSRDNYDKWKVAA